MNKLVRITVGDHRKTLREMIEFCTFMYESTQNKIYEECISEYKLRLDEIKKFHHNKTWDYD